MEIPKTMAARLTRHNLNVINALSLCGVILSGVILTGGVLDWRILSGIVLSEASALGNGQEVSSGRNALQRKMHVE